MQPAEPEPIDWKAISDTILIRMQADKDIWLWDRIRDEWTPEVKLEEIEIEGMEPHYANNTSTHETIHLILQSRLLSSSLYTDHKERSFCTVSPTDMRIILETPVLLGSALKRLKEERVIVQARSYPPTEHGTAAAIIGQDKQWHFYDIADLSQKAQKQQKQIGQILDKLAMKQPELSAKTAATTALDEDLQELRAMMQELTLEYYQYHQGTIFTRKETCNSSHTKSL